MNLNQTRLILRVSAVAVGAALAAIAWVSAAGAAESAAMDITAADLTTPASTVELGVIDVSNDSYKFGEYNGLQSKGITGNGALDLRGGGSYDSNDATRWRIIGTDLGLDTRDLSAEYGRQGSFRVDFSYDQLRRNRSDSYQTPFLGAGSNNLTLPGNWVFPPADNTTDPSTAGMSQLAADLHNVNLDTTRKKFDLGVSAVLDSHWDIKASARHETKDGLKTLGAPVGAAVSSLLPDPVQTSTDQYRASVNFKGKNSHLQLAYYGSLFTNDIRSLTFQNPYGDPAAYLSAFGTFFPGIGRTSSPPGNQLHRLSLAGDYKFSPTTKLTGTLSYARATQNQSFLPYDTDPTSLPPPQASLQGLVITKVVNLKLTAKPMKDLNLTAAYKYDDRDNRTPINLYQFNDVDIGSSNGTPNIRANTPYSKKINQFNADADYALTKAQWLKFGYDWQKIERWCNNTWVPCADAARTTENTVRIEWRTSAAAALSGKIGYAYSARRAHDYNQDANMWASFAGAADQALHAEVVASGFPAYGPVQGWIAGSTGPFANNNGVTLNGTAQNAYDVAGLRRFNMADRNRDKLRTALNYRASDAVSLQGGLDYNSDDYANSPYGLKSARSWILNVGGSYTPSEKFSANAYFTYQDQRSRSAGFSWGGDPGAGGPNQDPAAFTGTVAGGLCFGADQALTAQNGKIDPCRNWFTDMRDRIETIGLGFRRNELAAGKLDLTGDLVFSRARTNIGVSGGAYDDNTALTAYIPAQNLPEVFSNMTEVRLNAVYALDKASSVRLTYIFQHLRTDDYATNLVGPQTLSSVIGTNEVSPRYTIQMIAVSYIRTFR